MADWSAGVVDAKNVLPKAEHALALGRIEEGRKHLLAARAAIDQALAATKPKAQPVRMLNEFCQQRIREIGERRVAAGIELRAQVSAEMRIRDQLAQDMWQPWP